MKKFYCDKCKELIGPDGSHAKFRKGVGRLGGRELDTCGECSVLIEALIWGRPDDATPPTARPKAPRRPKPTAPRPVPV